MIYTPHILRLWNPGTSSEDEDGNPITTGGGYVNLCRCRCDDNGQNKMVGVAGEGIVYNHHIVMAEKVILRVGDKVDVLNEDGSQRASGEVKKFTILNRLQYAEIYL